MGGINQPFMTSHTIADVFSDTRMLKYKKRFQRLVPKKGRLFLSCLRYQKVSAQDIHHTTAHVPISHRPPQQ